MKNFIRATCIAILLVFIFSACRAEPQDKKPRCLNGLEFFTGFGIAKLDSKGTYHVIPLFVDFDFNLKPLTQKIGINPPALLQFVLEPFVSYVFSPNNNLEIGNNFLIKIGILPESAKFQPYFKGGIGLIYITQHTREQSTQFNFNEYAGVGIHYFFKKDMAFTLEYRYRHISNASMRVPNSGINTNFAICGISYRY